MQPVFMFCRTRYPEYRVWRLRRRAPESSVHIDVSLVLPSGRATCSNGTWELGDATCTAVEFNNGCSLPDVENGFFDPVGWVGAVDGQALDSNKVSCDQGYTRTNLGGVFCACPINGIPCEMLTGLCEPIQCPQVDIEANGVVAGANCSVVTPSSVTHLRVLL